MDSKKKNVAKHIENEVLLKKGSVNSENKERKVGMAAKDRIMVIRQKVQAEKKISVVDLSRICNVTEETIRRDLDKLETEGVVTRVHGGAIWNEGAQKEGVHFYRRMSKHLKEKQEIARKATGLFEGKNTIVADSSTTVVEALKLLPNSTDITVVTNSTEIFREFQQSAINFISTGGEYNKKSCSLQGQLAKTNIAKYNVSLALISCKGVSIEKGVQDTNESEAEIKKAMLAQADEVALLVDSSKFDQSAFVSLIGLDKVNYIITDSRPSEDWVTYCEDHEIQLIY